MPPDRLIVCACVFLKFFFISTKNFRHIQTIAIKFLLQQQNDGAKLTSYYLHLIIRYIHTCICIHDRLNDLLHVFVDVCRLIPVLLLWLLFFLHMLY